MRHFSIKLSQLWKFVKSVIFAEEIDAILLRIYFFCEKCKTRPNRLLQLILTRLLVSPKWNFSSAKQSKVPSYLRSNRPPWNHLFLTSYFHDSSPELLPGLICENVEIQASKETRPETPEIRCVRRRGKSRQFKDPAIRCRKFQTRNFIWLQCARVHTRRQGVLGICINIQGGERCRVRSSCVGQIKKTSSVAHPFSLDLLPRVRPFPQSHPHEEIAELYRAWSAECEKRYLPNFPCIERIIDVVCNDVARRAPFRVVLLTLFSPAVVNNLSFQDSNTSHLNSQMCYEAFQITSRATEPSYIMARER